MGRMGHLGTHGLRVKGCGAEMVLGWALLKASPLASWEATVGGGRVCAPFHNENISLSGQKPVRGLRVPSEPPRKPPSHLEIPQLFQVDVGCSPSSRAAGHQPRSRSARGSPDLKLLFRNTKRPAALSCWWLLAQEEGPGHLSPCP